MALFGAPIALEDAPVLWHFLVHRLLWKTHHSERSGLRCPFIEKLQDILAYSLIGTHCQDQFTLRPGETASKAFPGAGLKRGKPVNLFSWMSPFPTLPFSPPRAMKPLKMRNIKFR